MTRAAFAFVLVLVLAACGGTAPGTSAGPASTSLGTPAATEAATTPVPSATASNRLSGSFDIGGGRSLYLECIGSGSPTIVIEVGNEDTVGGSWGAVFGPMGEVSRTCGYNRANLGRSSAAAGPRTIGDLGEDLLKLLDVAGVKGPFVFVGGSFGGNIVSILAARHPEVVAGIVFADSEPANDNPALDPLKINLSDAQWQLWHAQDTRPAFDAPDNIEHIDYAASAPQELAAVAHQPHVPTIVLTATTRSDCQADWPCDRILVSETALQALWIAGNPLGQQIMVDSGHVMQRENAKAIVDAAQQVVTAIRAG